MAVTDFLSSKKGRSWRFAALSIVVHAGLITALVLATREETLAGAPQGEGEEVTYVDIATVPPPPPPAEPAAEPSQPDPTPQRQPEPQPEPDIPPSPTDIIEPDLDSLPDEPIQEVPLPEMEPTSEEGTAPRRVSATGGQEGGVEGGVEGGQVGGQVGATGVGGGGTYVAAVVDRQAELKNRRELPRIMTRLYPEFLQNAGVGGRVIVQFVVGTDGKIDMSTVKVMSSTEKDLEDPTREALKEFRFTPARKGDEEVRMLMQMPVIWEVQG